MKQFFRVITSVSVSIIFLANHVFADKATSKSKATVATESEVQIVGPRKCVAGELVTLQSDRTGGACAWVSVSSVNFPYFQR